MKRAVYKFRNILHCDLEQAHSMEATSITIPHCLKILRFWEQHGIAATLEAFGISRRTLYVWKKTLAEQGANALENRSRAPAARRRRRWPPTIITYNSIRPHKGKGL